MAINFVTRPPSNQQTWDAIWSQDPALVQGEGTEHRRKLELARETGDWSPLLIVGQVPTKFVLRQIPGEFRRRIIDRLNAGRIGGQELDALLVRLAVVDVVALGGFNLKFTIDEEWGRLATYELCNTLDDHAPGCVGELAVQIFNRMMGVSPKS